MGVVTDIQPLLDASRQRAKLQEAHKIAETRPEYGKISAPAPQSPAVLTDPRAIAVYAQLKTAAKTDPSLDNATCLQATALAAKITVLKQSEMEARSSGIYHSSIWQTLPNSAVARLQTLVASDYIAPQRHTMTEESSLLNWLSGSMTVLFFDAHGLVIQRLEMAESCCRLIKIPAHVYYTFVTEQHCLYLTMASQDTSVELAHWAPIKGHTQQPDYRKKLVNAQIGNRITLSTLQL